MPTINDRSVSIRLLAIKQKAVSNWYRFYFTGFINFTINTDTLIHVFYTAFFKNSTMALQPWRTGKVIRIKDETSDTRRFWVEVPEMSSFDFIPGQFVTLDLPIHEKPNKRWRSYSIAS